jgi:iron complex transport system substrate-binding protein
MRRRLFRVLLALACAAACAKPPSPPETTPTRIVALTAAAVDVVALLGELDRVVAVEEDCCAPGTDGKIKIRNDDHPGKLAAINVESILAVDPDAVIANPALKTALDGRGLRILWAPPYVDMDNLPGFVADIGALVGAPKRAQALLDAMHAKEAAIARRTAGLRPVRVYYETTGLGWTLGRDTVMDAMIRLAGGANAAGGIAKANVTLTAESILAFDPELIVLGPFADTEEEVRARPGWDRLAAVRANRIHRIPIERRHVTLGTPRCVDGCEEMLVPWLHPELLPAAKVR